MAKTLKELVIDAMKEIGGDRIHVSVIYPKVAAAQHREVDDQLKRSVNAAVSTHSEFIKLGGGNWRLKRAGETSTLGPARTRVTPPPSASGGLGEDADSDEASRAWNELSEDTGYEILKLLGVADSTAAAFRVKLYRELPRDIKNLIHNTYNTLWNKEGIIPEGEDVEQIWEDAWNNLTEDVKKKVLSAVGVSSYTEETLRRGSRVLQGNIRTKLQNGYGTKWNNAGVIAQIPTPSTAPAPATTVPAPAPSPATNRAGGCSVNDTTYIIDPLPQILADRNTNYSEHWGVGAENKVKIESFNSQSVNGAQEIYAVIRNKESEVFAIVASALACFNTTASSTTTPPPTATAPQKPAKASKPAGQIDKPIGWIEPPTTVPDIPEDLREVQAGNTKILMRDYIKNLLRAIDERFYFSSPEDARVFFATWFMRDGSCVLKGSPGCLTGESNFTTSNGEIIPFDTFDHLPSGIYNITGKLAPHNDDMTALHIYDVNKTVEVKTRSGRRLRMTPNHPLMTELGWKRADELKVGDKLKKTILISGPSEQVPLAIGDIGSYIDRDIIQKYHYGNGTTINKTIRMRRKYKNAITIPDKCNESVAAILGAFVAEGSLSKNRISYTLGIDEDEYRDFIATNMKSAFGHYKMVSKPHHSGRKCADHRIYNKMICEVVSRLAGKYKCVPKIILRSPNSVVSSFLSALFEGDGTVVCKSYVRNRVVNGKMYQMTERPRIISLKAGTGRRRLVEEVQVLLTRFGIDSVIHEYKTPYREGFNVASNREKTFMSYDLRITGKVNIERFSENIGFVSTVKKSKLKGITSGYRRATVARMKNDEWDAVVSSVVVDSPVKVYDVEVPKTHTFIANGIVSHNTGKTVLLTLSALALSGTEWKRNPADLPSVDLPTVLRWLGEHDYYGVAQHNADQEPEDVFFYTRIQIKKTHSEAGVGETSEYKFEPTTRPVVNCFVKLQNESNRISGNVADAMLGLLSEKYVVYKGDIFRSPRLKPELHQDWIDATKAVGDKHIDVGHLNFFDYNPHLDVESQEMDRALLDRIDVGIYLSGGGTNVRFSVIKGRRDRATSIPKAFFSDILNDKVFPLDPLTVMRLWSVVGQIYVDDEALRWISFFTNLPNFTVRRYKSSSYFRIQKDAQGNAQLEPYNEYIDPTVISYKPAKEGMESSGVQSMSGAEVLDEFSAIDALDRPLGNRSAESLLALVQAMTFLKWCGYNVANRENNALEFVVNDYRLPDEKRIPKRLEKISEIAELLPYVLDHRVNIGVGRDIQQNFLNFAHFIRYFFIPKYLNEPNNREIWLSCMDAIMEITEKDAVSKRRKEFVKLMSGKLGKTEAETEDMFRKTDPFLYQLWILAGVTER